MPCQDFEAQNYLDDHRTQSLINEADQLKRENNKLRKGVQQQELDDAIEAGRKLATKLNKTAAALCKATFILFKAGTLHKHEDLQTWFNEHTEEDATYLKTQLDKIMKHKSYTIHALIKWYTNLNDKEKWVFETHSAFKGIKLN